MANLGVISASSLLRKSGRTLPVWAADNALQTTVTVLPSRQVRAVKWWEGTNLNSLIPVGPDTGRIEGVITNNGVPVPGVQVSLFYAVSGAIISRTRTDANGVYKFGKNGVLLALDPAGGAKFYVVAEDPEISRNAVITDRITPSA